ncbi:MAG: acetylornithine/succinylornithine family transaminase [Myxococcales bacterium]|nr:acetylornithine/succinylornithine family transaminase [Myxococcales bacterium]
MTAHTQADLLAIADRTFIKNYRQQPMVLTRGAGCEVWDLEDKRYLDMTAGIAVCCLGHAHPELTERLRAQLGRLIHVSNLYWNDQEILAAQAITARSFADRVFFCNSGAEANEAALKLARRYQQVVAGAPARTTIISTVSSFHGRSVGTVSITGQPKYRDGFGPLFGPIEFVAYGDLDAARAAIARPEACAMIIEPIQAEGGIIVPPPGYLAGLRAACDAAGVLLIFDEVQTGTGRTGRWWGHEHDGVTPDVMTLAKGLGGGVPVGCLAVTERAAAGLTTPTGGAVPHASTFGGNPLATAAVTAVIDILDRDGLVAAAATQGDYLGRKLEALVAAQPERVLEARGRGLLRGVAVAGAPSQIVGRCRERGLLLSLAGANVVRFAPPYIVTTAQLDEAVAILGEVVAEVAS